MASAGDERALQVFNIRKEPKGHGRGKQIEGNFKEGDKVVVVDDVITTGGSTLKAIEVACPPDDQRVFQPQGSLADFNGEDTFGEWVMEVKVSETGGSAGSIQGWQVEFALE